MRTHRMLIAAGAAAMLLLTGCGDSGKPAEDSTTTKTVATSETVTETSVETVTEAPVPTGTLPVSRDASPGAALGIVDVRVAAHDTFDRVVFEFQGSGTPGWNVDYTADPTREGSGEPIEVAGRTVLGVAITGVGYPSDTGVEPYDGPNPVPGTSGVREVYLDGIFEGMSVAFIGVDADRPAVSVSTLSNPTRLVVDIAR